MEKKHNRIKKSDSQWKWRLPNLTKKNNKKANKEKVQKENIGVHLTVSRALSNRQFLKVS